MELGFQYGTRYISFNLIYRKRKNMSIEIGPSGEIAVISPLGVDYDTVIEKVKSKGSWIIGKLYEVSYINDKKIQREAVSGESFMYLGRSYSLYLVLDESVSDISVKLFRGKFMVKTNTLDEDSIKKALEFWYRAYDISVKRCWIHQIFDAALTFQGVGDDRPEFINIDFSDNLIEYCSMNFEFWAGNQGDGFESIIENIYFAKNIIRFGGYGWGGIQRPDKGDQALILGWNRLYNQMKNFVVTDNILDCADGNIIFTKGPNEQKGLTVNNNTYYQKAHVPTHKFNEIVRGSGQCASNQAEFEREIAQFEISPKKVEWLTD